MGKDNESEIFDALSEAFEDAFPEGMEGLFEGVLEPEDDVEYGNDYVTLVDDEGNEREFEHIDTVEYEDETYLAFIPAELSLEEEAEVVIMKVIEEDGEELLEGIDDDDIADAVFQIVMERAEESYG